MGRLYNQESAGSSPSSPCFERFSSHQGSPSPQRNLYCNWTGSPSPQRPCPPSTCFCYCSPVTSPSLIHQPPITSPVNSPQLTRISLETGPGISTPHVPGDQGNYSIVSPLLTHRPLRTSLTISPPLVHQPVVATSISHRVMETGPMISHWSSGRCYNDPPLSSASTPPTGSLYHDHPKPSDSCEPKPPLDGSLGKNSCGPPPSPQAGMPCSPILPQEGSFHYSHFCSESQVSAPRSPYCVINLPPESSGSPSSSQPQSPHKTCVESFLSWETGGNSYLLLTPGSVISGPPCPTEPPHPQCPYPALYFPSSLGNQVVAPPQSTRSYNDPPHPTPVTPQVKSPKFSDSQRTPYRCRSMINTPHHTPLDHPKSHKTNISPQPPSQAFGLSSPLMEPSITMTSNSLPKELSPEATLDPGILKTVAPTSCPQCLPCNPLLPTRYPKSSPHGPAPVSPCNTHMYSVVPPTSHSSPASSPLNPSTHFPHNQPVATCGTYTAPRGPPPPNSKPVVPPCSTHIYSFIPLRTPFDPRCLSTVPRARLCPNTIPCGLHTYAVSSPGPHKDPPQIPYSCPLPSSKSSTCNTTASCSSTIIVSKCYSNEIQSNQDKSQNQNKSSRHDPSKSPQNSGFHRSRSWSRSSSTSQCNTRDHSESVHVSISGDKSEELHHRSRKQSKSPGGMKSKSRSKSPRHKKSHGRSNSPSNKKK